MIIEETRKFVKNLLEKEGTGHDWWHIERVYQNALHIMEEEKCDEKKVKLAVLLHDIGDYKLHDGVDKTQELVSDFLRKHSISEDEINSILKIIKQISFSENQNQKPDSIEAQIAQDADRLDAMGAIGIARAFAYGGSKGRLLYHPDIEPENYQNTAQYRISQSPTINHFYEKLLLLKNTMNTEAAKKIAINRHHFMEMYLEQFFEEWKGER